MQIQRTYDQATELFWLAFLLTGDETSSEQALMDSLANDCTPESLRSLVIRRALKCVDLELRLSRQRAEAEIQTAKTDTLDVLSPAWSSGHEIRDEHVRSALFSLDVFPRSVVLLSLFAGLTIAQTARFLRTSVEFTKICRSLALLKLARNIARQQGWFSIPQTQDSELCQVANV